MRHFTKKICKECNKLKSINYHFDYAGDDLCMECKKGNRYCRICKQTKEYKKFARNKKYCKQCVKNGTITEKRRAELREMNNERVFHINCENWDKVTFNFD